MRYYMALILLLGLLLLSVSVSAGVYRVRPPQDCTYNGDGSTWGCAASNGAAGAMKFPVTSWDRGVNGSTYYLAGGTYSMSSSWNLNASTDGTKVITVKHANAADNSGDIGWQTSFAKQILMSRTGGSYTSLSIGAYYVVDGGNRSDWDSGYGWKIYSPQSSDSAQELLVSLGSYSTIQGIHLLNAKKNVVYDHIRRGVSASSYSTVRYCMFEESSKAVSIYAGSYGDKHDITIEHCYFYNLNLVSGGTHPDIIDLYDGPDNIVVRYNWFENCFSGPVDHSITGNCTVDNLQVYGNIFRSMDDNVVGTESSSHPCKATNWKIYNNTIVDNDGGIGKGYPTTNKCSGWQVKNNVFYNVTEGQRAPSCGTWAFNFYNDTISGIVDSGTGSVVDNSQMPAQLFRDYYNKDFRPVESANYLNIGIDLGASYNTDLYGVTRGLGDGWEMGAYEYNGDTAQPQPPQNFRFGTQ